MKLLTVQLLLLRLSQSNHLFLAPIKILEYCRTLSVREQFYNGTATL